jgi:hypothetical protein
MDCAKLMKCPFFNDKMANAPASTSLLKMMYCHGDFLKCARFIVSSKLGPEGVPEDLFPHQVDKAKLLLASSQGSSGDPGA